MQPQAGPDNLTFSFITPAYNNPEEVKKLIDSIRPEFIKDATVEAIVVDDCSLDDSIRKVVEESGFAKYIRLDSNSGPAEARNAGAKFAKNKILIFVDSDVILNNDTLSKIRNKFAADSSIEVFGGEYDIEPANPSVSTRFKSLMVRSWTPRENFVTDFLTRLGAIRRDLFNDMGGFDTGMKTASVEDYEFGRRLMEKGRIIHYDPKITVKHHFPRFKDQIRLFFHRAFTWMHILKKYGRFDNTCTTPLLAVSQICGFFSAAFFILSLLNAYFLYLSMLALALFILTNLRFFKLTLRHEGWLFTAASIVMAVIAASSVVLGAFCGGFYYFIIDRLKRKD